jgi:hypothetical protein
MAAKKRNGSITTPPKKVPRKPTDGPAFKKVNKPAKTQTLDTLLRHEELDPEVLANLAVRILHLGGGVEAAPESRPFRLAASAMHDALDDARRLLLAAKGLIDDDVDAYRLFSAEDGLMSYVEIADRFSRCGWQGMTARNTVEKIILELVKHAEKEVQREREKHDSLISVRCNYPGGVSWLAERMGEQIRKVIRASELELLFSDPDRVAHAMGQVFLRLMTKDITGDWERPLDEESADTLGFATFIKYVCGEMTYEQFIPDKPNVRMDLGRLDCLVFFLEGADAWKVSDYMAKAKDLGVLMRFIREPSGVPDSARDHLERLLEELRKTPPERETVESIAKVANVELGNYCERMHLAHSVKVQDWRAMALRIQSILSMEKAGSFEIPQSRELQVVLELIRQTEESLQNQKLEPAGGRSVIEKLLKKLTQVSSRLKTQPTLRVITEEMNKIAGNLEDALRSQRLKPMHLGSTLEDLIHSLKPSKAARKCRPYELFLFAAQNRLCWDELVRKRSVLATGVVTGPPHKGSLSILMSHRGAEIAMGIKEPR